MTKSFLPSDGKPTIILRADAGRAIGAGHLMRCVALARALAPDAVPILAASVDPELVVPIARLGITVVPIERAHPHPSDADGVVDLSRRVDANAVVVDGYHFDQAYVDRLSDAGLKTAMVEDEARLDHYACDILIDQNLGALSKTYRISDRTRTMLGPRFAMLRPEIQALRGAPQTRRRAERLLITMGASDPLDATGLVARALAALPDRFHATIVVGPANPRLAQIAAVVRAMPNMQVLQDPPGFESLIGASDIAVAAVGGTMWELACLGVPTLLLSGSDLHHGIARTADRYGAHSWVGPVSATTENDLRAALVALADDEHRRSEMSRLGRALIDGRGASRVAAALSRPAGKWIARPAIAGDAESAWEICGGAERFADFERTFIEWRSADSRPWVMERDETIGAVALQGGSSAAADIIATPWLTTADSGTRRLADAWKHRMIGHEHC